MVASGDKPAVLYDRFDACEFVADDLPALVYNPSYKPEADRVRPPIRDEDRPKDAKRTLRKSSVDLYLRQIETLYQNWFLSDEFANKQIAGVEARLIK